MEFKENEVIDLGNGVWIRNAVDNICWYDLGNGVAVIDALEDASQADVVRNLIKQTTGSDLKWVVNTHWDVDHIACNPQWRREGVPVIAHETCLKAAQKQDPAGRPDITYSKKATLVGENGRRIEMEWIGGTHTRWDCLLYFPEAKILHVADVFGWGLIPCHPNATRIGKLSAIYRKIQKYDADTVICGHGPVANMGYMQRFAQYLNSTVHQIAMMMYRKHTREEILEEVTAPPDMHDWWGFTDWKHRKNVEMVLDFYR